ncbi:MAG: SDR family NAD(P)-dependent oxidoreductase, partial [Victivallaceae bacterium]|nr:SDR family NAD(P)-dependent oxidoreductase [Victivallaceae bacterium]
MSLATIVELSHLYGKDPEFVLAGGGNTSFKDEKYLYIKPSGVRLAEIQESDFVKLDRKVVAGCFSLGDFSDKDLREAEVKRLMAYAVVPGSSGRPSVEAPLHELMDFTYVVHVHPALVNGMTCGRDGQSVCAKLFPDALWIGYVDPGFTLAGAVYQANEAYKAAHGSSARVIFLQNHGVFVGGDTDGQIRDTYCAIMETLRAYYAAAKVDASAVVPGALAPATVLAEAPLLRGILAEGNLLPNVRAVGAFRTASGPLTPDHMVYAKSFSLRCEAVSAEAVSAFVAERGYQPKVVEIPGKAVFCCGSDGKGAKIVETLALDAARVEKLAEAFGGVHYLDDAQRSFIENWEVESYRRKVSAGAGGAKPLAGKVAVVTGGAQGFGFGIAEVLAAEGADVVIADMNADGAAAAAAKLGANASSVAVNISDEASVEAMV